MPSPIRHLFVTLALACQGAPVDSLDSDRDAEAHPWPACEPDGALDDTLRLNELQLLGTHNSYHIEPAVPVHPSHRYTHPPLDEQFDVGVRQIELDLFYRTHDGTQGGYEVFHIPNIDEETTCRQFTTCLEVVRDWSQAHPCHVPIVVWVEPKDLDGLDPTLEPFLDKLDALDDDILSVWPRERLITPDDVRGPHPDLPTALAADGWPTLADTRGKLIFSMLERGPHREAYLEPSPILEGRVMFVATSQPDDPFAAMFKINNAVSDVDRVQAMVDAGFHVTSNAAAADQTPEERDARFQASAANGTHAISSDFVVPEPGSGYVSEFPEGSPRCHPRTAPSSCDEAFIEP